MTGKPPPLELVMAWMCEHYRCLPSELLQEPANLVFRFYHLSQTYTEYYNKRPRSMR